MGTSKNFGRTILCISIYVHANHRIVDIDVDVVPVDVMLLIGFDSLGNFKMTVDINNERIFSLDGFTSHLSLKGSHLFYE